MAVKKSTKKKKLKYFYIDTVNAVREKDDIMQMSNQILEESSSLSHYIKELAKDPANVPEGGVIVYQAVAYIRKKKTITEFEVEKF